MKTLLLVLCLGLLSLLIGLGLGLLLGALSRLEEQADRAFRPPPRNGEDDYL